MQCPYRWLLFEKGKGRMEGRATVLTWVTRRENCQKENETRENRMCGKREQEGNYMDPSVH